MPQRSAEDAFRDIATSTSGNIGRLANSSESFHFRSGLLYKTLNFGIVNGLGKIQVWTYEKKYGNRKRKYVCHTYFLYVPKHFAEPVLNRELKFSSFRNGFSVEPVDDAATKSNSLIYTAVQRNPRLLLYHRKYLRPGHVRFGLS